MCILLCFSQITDIRSRKGGTRPVGVGVRKKPKDLSGSDREECGHGEGVGVYTTLLQ